MLCLVVPSPSRSVSHYIVGWECASPRLAHCCVLLTVLFFSSKKSWKLKRSQATLPSHARRDCRRGEFLTAVLCSISTFFCFGGVRSERHLRLYVPRVCFPLGIRGLNSFRAGDGGFVGESGLGCLGNSGVSEHLSWPVVIRPLACSTRLFTFPRGFTNIHVLALLSRFTWLPAWLVARWREVLHWSHFLERSLFLLEDDGEGYHHEKRLLMALVANV